MLFRQLFDRESGTYTYLLAAGEGAQAIIIDPVLDHTDHYLRLLDELDLKLMKVIDTHVHADHITAAAELRDRTRCITVMGIQSSVDSVSQRICDGEKISVEGLSLTAIYTPGHTDDSYSFLMNDRVFTGDTLLIRGTGRTDFQNGDAGMAWDSITTRLLTLPDQTLVYPGHDYKGDTVSTIGEERRFNPRLQVDSRKSYIELMGNLRLDNPKMMDVAVPANRKVALAQQEIEENGWAWPASRLAALLEKGEVLLIDLREDAERSRNGYIESSINIPYNSLEEVLGKQGILTQLAETAGKKIVFYCAFGERSAMALLAAREAGIECFHLQGGLAAWTQEMSA